MELLENTMKILIDNVGNRYCTKICIAEDGSKGGGGVYKWWEE